MDVAKELDRGGWVPWDSHGDGELLREGGVGSSVGAGDRHSVGSSRRLTGSCGIVPSPGAVREAEQDSPGVVGEGLPGEERGLFGSSASVGTHGSLIGAESTPWLWTW
mgnify:CR=1 FL=1